MTAKVMELNRRRERGNIYIYILSLFNYDGDEERTPI